MSVLGKLALLAGSTLIATSCLGHPRAFEADAIGALRTVNDALREHREACGAYPASIAVLGGPVPAAPGERSCVDHPVLYSGLVTRFQRRVDAPEGEEYALIYEPSEPIPNGFDHYQVHATRVGRGLKKWRSFWSSDARIITWATGRPASAADEPI
jgi:hypothetical protein